MADERFVVMTVECQHCKTKQKVHVAARTGFALKGDQTIPCINCNKHFRVKVPARIVDGPFPCRRTRDRARIRRTEVPSHDAQNPNNIRRIQGTLHWWTI